MIITVTSMLCSTWLVMHGHPVFAIFVLILGVISGA